jgi:hypothetical protein
LGVIIGIAAIVALHFHYGRVYRLLSLTMLNIGLSADTLIITPGSSGGFGAGNSGLAQLLAAEARIISVFALHVNYYGADRRVVA